MLWKEIRLETLEQECPKCYMEIKDLNAEIKSLKSENNISKADLERKIQEGVLEYHIKEIENLEISYVTRYCLDLDIKTIVVEIRIHADEDGKFHILGEYKGMCLLEAR